jgi:hypothetical protein
VSNEPELSDDAVAILNLVRSTPEQGWWHTDEVRSRLDMSYERFAVAAEELKRHGRVRASSIPPRNWPLTLIQGGKENR